jgi:hypothetical protein
VPKSGRHSTKEQETLRLKTKTLSKSNQKQLVSFNKCTKSSATFFHLLVLHQQVGGEKKKKSLGTLQNARYDRPQNNLKKTRCTPLI